MLLHVTREFSWQGWIREGFQRSAEKWSVDRCEETQSRCHSSRKGEGFSDRIRHREPRIPYERSKTLGYLHRKWSAPCLPVLYSWQSSATTPL